MNKSSLFLIIASILLIASISALIFMGSFKNITGKILYRGSSTENSQNQEDIKNIIYLGNSKDKDNKDDEESPEANSSQTSNPIQDFIAAESLIVKKQDIFETKIMINSQEPIHGIEFKLSFEEDKLEFIEILEGTFLKQGGETFSVKKDALGEVIFAEILFEPSQGVNGEGTIAILKFKAISEGESNLEFQKIKIIKENLEEIVLESLDGEIIIS